MSRGASQVGLVVKTPPVNAGGESNMGSTPGNPMDRGAYGATIHRVAKSRA